MNLWHHFMFLTIYTANLIRGHSKSDSIFNIGFPVLTISFPFRKWFYLKTNIRRRYTHAEAPSSAQFSTKQGVSKKYLLIWPMKIKVYRHERFPGRFDCFKSCERHQYGNTLVPHALNCTGGYEANSIYNGHVLYFRFIIYEA